MDYTTVIDYLTEVIGASLKGFGDTDEKVNKAKEARICDLFERYISARDGDAISDYFKVTEGDVPYMYNGRFYERIDDMKLRFVIKKVMDNVQIGLVYRKNSHSKIATECFESLCCNEGCFLEPDRQYLVFQNCVLDTKSGGVYEHDIKYKTDVVMDFDYDPTVRLPLWDTLVESTIPDAGMRHAFQQFCGAFLADREEFKIEYMCLLVGGGRNGKSVVSNAIAGVFGDGLISHYSPEQLFRSSQSLYNLADINGKLANFSDDVSNKDFSGGDFKQFISGARFQARHPYGRPFTVTKVPLMLCCVNEVPPTTDDTQGHFRRLLPILCPNQIADKDVDVALPQKLSTKEAKAAIFNWVLEGYRMLVRNNGKITISESIKEAKNEIQEDSNSARRWIKEYGYVVVKPTSDLDERWKSMKEWMKEYQLYCKDYSETPKSPKAVGKIFKEMGFVSQKRADTTWYCIGTKASEPQVATEYNRVVDEVDDGDLPFS